MSENNVGYEYIINRGYQTPLEQGVHDVQLVVGSTLLKGTGQYLY
jgi:hypothetical protein